MDLSPGLTVLHGPNEAGKSTLMAFIRGCLFGFPDGRSKQPLYPPLQGGRHGGRIFLTGEDGDYVLHREAKSRARPQIQHSDGSEATDEDLRRLVGGADDGLFRSVFAFGLSDLQSLDRLSAQGIRDRIFSATITGRGQSARKVLDGLSKQADELLRGRTDSITALSRQLDELEPRLDDARTKAREHDRLRHEEESLATNVASLAKRMAELRDEATLQQTYLDLWPIWVDGERARKELSTLEDVGSFPIDSDARLAAMLETVSAAERRVGELATEQKIADQARAKLPIDERLTLLASKVETLQETAALQRTRLSELSDARRHHADATLTAGRALSELGAGWDEPRIASFDSSVQRREKIRALEQQLVEVRREADKADQQTSAPREVVRQVTARRSRAASSLPKTDPPTLAELDRQRDALRRLRTALSQHHDAQVEKLSAEKKLGDLQKEDRDLDNVRALVPIPKAVEIAGWLLVALLGAGSVPIGLSGQFGSLGVLLLVAFVGAVLVLYLRRNRQLLSDDAGRRQLNRERLREEIKRANLARESHEKNMARLESQLAADAQALALPPVPSAREIEERARVLEEQILARRTVDSLKKQLADDDVELAKASADLARLEETAARAVRTRDVANADFVAWKVKNGLPANLSVQGVLDLLAAVRDCAQRIAERERTRAVLEELEKEVTNWETRASAAIAEAGLATLVGAELVDAISTLRRRCVANEESRSKAAVLDEQMSARAERIVAAGRDLERCVAERDQFFVECQSSSEGDFRRRLEIFKRRHELMSIAEGSDQTIQARLGRTQTSDARRSVLATGDVESWKSRVAAIKHELDQLQQSRDAVVRQHRDAEKAREDIEVSANVAALDSEREAIVEELAVLTRRWRILALARNLVENTLVEFVRTRQPDVLKEASRAFGEITDGRYKRVVQASENEDLVVEDYRGQAKRPSDLSRGTAEQLYLCLRLGLATEFAKRNTRLPLLMDDVLVNFDPGRAKTTARLLTTAAREHQILFFTCHPHVRDLLQQIDDKAKVIEFASSAQSASVTGSKSQPPVALLGDSGPTKEDQEEGDPEADDDTATQPRGDGGESVDERLSERVLAALAETALSRSELAHLLGAPPEAVVRVLNELRARGRVSMTGKKRGARWSRAVEDRGKRD